ncbi:hypothetical protein FJZ18_02410 [Candidatus Pacearchaeota archaeon]|nr:hypothetical protein [Candidatus Pacearchaeota archaeon]
MQKRGQMAIIIIIAILVVIAVILLMLNRGSLSIIGGEALSPHSYLTSCIEPHITSTLSTQLKQGGAIIPESSVEYEGDKISYLCYTSENYKTCTVQKPMIKSQVERELAERTSEKSKSCLDSLINEYRKRGYEVSSSSSKTSIDIVPGKIAVAIVSPLTIRKEGTQSFDRFDLSIKSEAYELLIIGESIVNYESTFGDSETTDFINAYPNLKIEKIKIPNGIKIYRVSSLTSNERFQFASRSLVWPPGYGI